MEALIVLLLAWLIIPPILGMVAFAKYGSLKQEIESLRRQLLTLAGSEPRPAPDQRSPPEQSSERSEPIIPPIETPLTTPASPRATQVKQAPIEQSGDAAPKTPPPPARARNANWEQLIAANWLVWAGGLALVVGALFLLRVTIEAGLFGPWMRVGAGSVLGIAMIAGSWRSKAWTFVQNGSGAAPHIPAMLAGAGVITLYGASLAAGVLYGLLPPLIILCLFALVSVIALMLALSFGPVLAIIGLTGAYISPFFTGAQGGSALLLLPYTMSVTAVGLALVSWRDWRFGSVITLAGSLLWGVIALGDPSDAAAWAVPVCALSLILIAVVFSHDKARRPLDFSKPREILQGRGEALLVTYAFWIGSGLLLAISSLDFNVEFYALSAMSIYVGLGLLLAWRREGYALFAPISVAMVFGVLGLWPDWSQTHSDVALAVSIAVGVAGLALFPRVEIKAPLAATSALTPPIALFLVFWRGASFEQHILWGVAAIGLAIAMVTILERLRRSPGGQDAVPGVSASYALGGILCVALAPFLVLSELWLGTGLAVAALAIALTYRRFTLPVLRIAGIVAASIATVLLIRPDMLARQEISPILILNELTGSYVLAILSLMAAGWILKGRDTSSDTYFGTAGILGFVLIGLQIRHVSGGGQLDGPMGGLGEASGYAIAYLGSALSLVWKFGQTRSKLLIAAQFAAFAAGCIGVIYALNAVSWDRASGVSILNLLFVALAMPALLLAGLSHSLRTKDRVVEANGSAVLAILLGWFWISAEVRRLHVGEFLSANSQALNANSEMWTYSAAWLVYALALLGLGVWRQRPLLRFTSLGLLAITIIKVFLFDMSITDGIWRATSFMGLGLTLLGVALFYQRFVFNSDRREEVQPTK